jgi:hypothetical protein
VSELARLKRTWNDDSGDVAMRMKSISALFLILSGLALISFETSFYGASPVAAAPQAKLSTQVVIMKTKPLYPAKRYGTKHYGPNITAQ